MSKNVTVNGENYTGVSQVQLAITDGGTAFFKDVDEITTPSGTKTITSNGTHDVKNYAQAVVNVANSGITPSGSISITENGTYNVTNYASATVNVEASGGTEEYWFSKVGAMYFKNMVVPAYQSVTTKVPISMYESAENLESIVIEGREMSGVSTVFSFCTKLKTAVITAPNSLYNYVFRNCTALESVQLGSVGNAVESIAATAFNGCTKSGLTITVYVADDTTLPMENAPWGATAATIVYKSATTGEVVTV